MATASLSSDDISLRFVRQGNYFRDSKSIQQVSDKSDEFPILLLLITPAESTFVTNEYKLATNILYQYSLPKSHSFL